MCLIAFAWQAHPRWRLVLAGNRDEFHARPSAELARWADLPIAAGRDLEAGGTWLGVTDAGRCCVVTNVRDPRDPQRGASRGLLATDYLAGAADATAHARELLVSAADYRPFNLLTFDARAAFYLGNRPEPRAEAVGPGVHGLSNADFNTPWPKTRALMTRLQTWLVASPDEDFAPLFAALADEQQAPDAELPDTGVGLERERWLSSAFIRGEHYGTRASTVVAIGHDGLGVIVERRFGPEGRFLGESRLGIGPHAATD
ncbi:MULTISPECIES: NRDE family protein [Rhodanobacter]|uniref:NRDE family protein n=1 Tax=Rhodanobacter hydrolyticus TaxID=2250595 RepID=A0ABW8J5Y2_9GAMM|nr:NRDE family protein [Rhodanobacter sp. 7MK24]MBD8881433.1 NRDE family protein [Rhodanobacter sp. 7MK24]